MAESSRSPLDLQHALLDSIGDEPESAPTFASNLNVHGLYETMRFVLRLSPRNHELMEMIPASGVGLGTYSQMLYRLFPPTSTKPSIGGSMWVQLPVFCTVSATWRSATPSMGQLREVLATIGPKKPLKAIPIKFLGAKGTPLRSNLRPPTLLSTMPRMSNITSTMLTLLESTSIGCTKNRISNQWATDTSLVYGQLVDMLADAIDPEYVILPNPKSWESETLRMRQERVEGYYWRSPVRLPAVGLQAVYEGQARITQLQFLDVCA